VHTSGRGAIPDRCGHLVFGNWNLRLGMDKCLGPGHDASQSKETLNALFYAYSMLILCLFYAVLCSVLSSGCAFFLKFFCAFEHKNSRDMKSTRFSERYAGGSFPRNILLSLPFDYSKYN
jgi:hypothetical protein